MKTVEELHNVLLTEEAEQRIAAIYDLATCYGRSEQAMTEVVEALKDTDSEVILNAALALAASFGWPEVQKKQLIKKGLETWGTCSPHALSGSPINLREMLLYPLALMGDSGRSELELALSNDDETVRSTAALLLDLQKRPFPVEDGRLTMEKTCRHFGWDIPAIASSGKPVVIPEDANPVVVGIVAIFSAQQGLFGTGIRSLLNCTYLYSMDRIPVGLHPEGRALADQVKKTLSVGDTISSLLDQAKALSSDLEPETSPEPETLVDPEAPSGFSCSQCGKEIVRSVMRPPDGDGFATEMVAWKCDHCSRWICRSCVGKQIDQIVNSQALEKGCADVSNNGLMASFFRDVSRPKKLDHPGCQYHGSFKPITSLAEIPPLPRSRPLKKWWEFWK